MQTKTYHRICYFLFALALVLSAIGAAGKRQFYKRIVASELKRQLAVVNGKLDNLQAQNEALRAELARLKQEK